MKSSASVRAEANGKSDGVGIMLMDGRSGGFQFVDDDGGFFGGNQFVGGRSTELADHLLVIVHVQGIARLHGGELLVEIAGVGKIAGLDRSVSQQLDDFGDVSGLTGFLKRSRSFSSDAGLSRTCPMTECRFFKTRSESSAEQAVGVLIVNLERILVLAGLHESVGESGDGGQVIVDAQEFTGQTAASGQAAVLEISL